MRESDLMQQLQMGWTFIQLRGYRNFKDLSTYETFNFQELPPIREPLDASFKWLKRGTPKYLHSIGRCIVTAEYLVVDGTLVQENENQEAVIEYINYIQNDAIKLLQTLEAIGQPLPYAFKEFICNHELYNRVRSCTGCHFELAVVPAKTIEPLAGYLIRFLVDSQGSPKWYLYVSSQGEEAVLVSRSAYGYNSYDVGNWAQHEEMETVDLLAADVLVCARSFEEFIYRFWIENEIWFALAYNQEINDGEMQNYLAHYGDNPPVEDTTA